MLSPEEAMGRGKIQLKPIRDKKRRAATFATRIAGLKKKSYELSTLCGVPVALVCFGPEGQRCTSPENEAAVRDTVARFLSICKEQRKVYEQDLYGYLNDEIVKLRKKLARLQGSKSEEGAVVVPVTDQSMDGVDDDRNIGSPCQVTDSILFSDPVPASDAMNMGMVDAISASKCPREPMPMFDHANNYVADDCNFEQGCSSYEPMSPIFNASDTLMPTDDDGHGLLSCPPSPVAWWEMFYGSPVDWGEIGVENSYPPIEGPLVDQSSYDVLCGGGDDQDATHVSNVDEWFNFVY